MQVPGLQLVCAPSAASMHLYGRIVPHKTTKVHEDGIPRVMRLDTTEKGGTDGVEKVR
jgi:hypothetical protein